MKYIKSFSTTDEMNDFIDTAENGYYVLRDESAEAGSRINIEYITNPAHMCLKALEDNSTIKLTTSFTTIQYSIDNGTTWNNYTSGDVITLNKRQKSYWRTSETQTSGAVGQFAMTGSIAGSGDTNSLISTNFENNHNVLYTDCYNSLFANCTALTTAPDLLSTLSDRYGTPRCYYSMFLGCSNLTYIKCLILTPGAYNSYVLFWTKGVATNGTFIKNVNATSWATSSDGIPSGWTVVEE